MENKNKINKILLYVAMGLALLHLAAICILNFVPSIVGGLFIPPSVSYDTALDIFSLISAGVVFVLTVAYCLMALKKISSGSNYRWYHGLITALFVVMCLLFPTVMNMFTLAAMAVDLGRGALSESGYLFMSCLYKTEIVIRYLTLASTAMAVGSFCGSWYTSKGKKEN